jgi:hypothetical protein
MNKKGWAGDRGKHTRRTAQGVANLKPASSTDLMFFAIGTAQTIDQRSSQSGDRIFSKALRN